MREIRVARLLGDGGEQFVVLPAEFRFEGDQVFLARDERTGDVVLSSCPGAATWAAFFDRSDAADASADFRAERPMNGPIP